MTIKRKVKLIKGFVEKYKEMLINDYELAKEELGVPFELFVFTVCDSKELYDYTSKYYHQLKNEFDKIDNESVRQCYDNATFLNYIMWTKLYHNIENRLN